MQVVTLEDIAHNEDTIKQFLNTVIQSLFFPFDVTLSEKIALDIKVN